MQGHAKIKLHRNKVLFFIFIFYIFVSYEKKANNNHMYNYIHFILKYHLKSIKILSLLCKWKRIILKFYFPLLCLSYPSSLSPFLKEEDGFFISNKNFLGIKDLQNMPRIRKEKREKNPHVLKFFLTKVNKKSM